MGINRHDGFVGTTIFPGHSPDFFDQKHHVVVSAKLSLRVSVCAASDDLTQLGGSYAPAPRLADRRTLRNFYQHNYRYVWTYTTCKLYIKAR